MSREDAVSGMALMSTGSVQRFSTVHLMQWVSILFGPQLRTGHDPS